VQDGEALARRLANQQESSNQLRRFLGALRKIEARGESWFQSHADEVVFLKVPLTWAAARERKLEEFSQQLESRIDAVDNFEKFKSLTKFVEVVVAYHKKHGGPD